MAGFLEGLGINATEVEKVVEDNQSTGGGIIAPGVYKMQIEKAYVRRTDSGAEGLTVEFNYGDEGDKKFYWTTYFKSGDEKGNKTTYTAADGSEKPLPGFIDMITLFKAAGVPDAKPKPAKIEIGGDAVDVLALPELTGKVVTLGIRHEYDDYNEADRAFVDTILDAEGKNVKGEDVLDKLKEKIEKSPKKKPRKKKETKTATTTAGSEEKAASPW